MTALPDPRELAVGILTRLSLTLPLLAVMWLFNITISPLAKAVLVPAVLLMFAIDHITRGPIHTGSLRVRPAP